MNEQPIPSEASCPECGAEPTDESVVHHNLSNMGYLHDDIGLECSECGNNWTLGRPIGETDMGDDLICGSCDIEAKTHRFKPEFQNGEFTRATVHLKCPQCNNFWTVEREPGPKGVMLMGFPSITGSREDAVPYGWSE